MTPGPEGAISPRSRRRSSNAIRYISSRSPTCRRTLACTSPRAAPGAQRELNILIGKNVEAGRLMAGVTFSQPGNWTSWPPHEHAVLAEEAYLYIDMPAPAFGVQLVYTNKTDPQGRPDRPRRRCRAHAGGYHPNVAAPGGPINFLWFMAANREDEDRLFGVVNVQPEFAGGRFRPRQGEEMNWDSIPSEQVAKALSGRWSSAKS